MISRLRVIHVAAALILTLAHASQASAGLPAQERAASQPFYMPNTQVFHLASTIVGREFEVDVQLPGNYTDPQRSFPVIYVLDAQWDFPLVASLYGQQYFDGFVPAALVVGITWGGNSPNYDSLRARDLTPTFNKELPQSGNGEKFLAFITAELIPTIDSMFRTKRNDRTLMGSSFGGLFTLYAMFRETKVFHRYVAASPALWWDNGSISSFEREYGGKRSDVPIRLFVAGGGLEPAFPLFEKFAADISSRSYSGLKFQSRILEGIGHSGSKAEGFTRGLQYVFAKVPVDVDPAILKQYAGTYELRPGFTVKLALEGAKLVAHLPGNSTQTLEAETDSDFYVRGEFSAAHFERDKSGNVTGFRWEQYSGEQFIKKIE